MVPQEFQAVILAAGRGTRLPEVIGDTPKCLLPIGPYPLLWFPLNTLQQHNFQEVIVIVLEDEKLEIQQALERTHLTLKIKIDFVTIPKDSDFGTADSLRFINEKIKSDFLVLSCDVITNASLYPLINKFREHDASVGVLFFKSGFESGVVLPGPKTKQKPERDLVGIHPDTQRLLFLAATSDFEEVMTINAHLLRKNGKMTVFSRLTDSHIYVMKKWMIDVLEKKQNYSTLKGEFLPYIIKKQMSKPNSKSVTETQSEIGYSTKPQDNIFHYIPNTNLTQQIQKSTLFNDSRSKDPYHGDLVRCYAIETPKDSISIRVNTTLSFYAVNQKLSSIWSLLVGDQACPFVSNNAVINSTQTKEIAVADNAQLSEKTSLSFSVFGPNCTIYPKNIVTKSIIMAHAIVEEGCNIENCIVGNKAHIKKGSKLKSCIIGPNFVVEENFKRESQHLTNADGFMEIDIQ